MKRIAIFFIGAAALAIAGVTFTGSSPALAAKACIDVYMPVCGINGLGVKTTYSNACWAKKAHARILHPGVCFGPICLDIYDPVCAISPITHRPQTYSNLCYADRANATWTHNGACGKPKRY
jgi:hypothetical protein